MWRPESCWGPERQDASTASRLHLRPVNEHELTESMPVFNTPHARLAYRLSRLLRLTTTLSTRRLSRDGVSNKRGMNLFEAGERTDIEDDGHTALPWRGPW